MKFVRSIFCLALLTFFLTTAGCSAEDKGLFSTPMYGVEITTEGEILQHFGITITATDASSDQDGVTHFSCQVQFKDTTSAPFGDHTLNGVRQADDDFYIVGGIGYCPALNQYAGIEIIVDAQLESCLIVVDNSRIYVCSETADFDAQALLTHYQAWL